MLRKFTPILKNSKAFSLVEVMVAIFISSVIIFSVVESYRYILSVTSQARSLEKTLTVVKSMYNQACLGKIVFKDGIKFYTNVSGVDVVIVLTNKVSQEPLVSDVIILATNGNFTFSVITSISPYYY